VDDRDARQLVRDGERAELVGGVVVPDDADAVAAELGDAERPRGRRRAAELRARARRVRALPLGDLEAGRTLAFAERNLAVGAAERAVERERDPLRDVERAVALDENGDVGFRQRERLGGGRLGEEEGGDGGGRRQNCTRGASRAGSSISK
jgi:hypothetical protein